MNQYDPPANYGIPNPYGPRTHNWKGGPLNEGSLFHGPVYTRPVYNLPRISRPVFGVETNAAPDEKGEMMKLAVGSVVIFGLAYLSCEMLLPKPRR